MKNYVFEIHTKGGMDKSFADILLNIFLAVLEAFSIKVTVAGVAEEGEVENG